MVVTIVYPYLQGGDYSLPLPTWRILKPTSTYMVMTETYPYLHGGDYSLLLPTWR